MSDDTATGCSCEDCGQAVSLCDHALARLTDPTIAFQGKVIGELRADIAALRARLEAASAALAVEKALDEVYEWQRETFPLRTPSSIAAHLAEEAGELAREPLDTEEMADVAMLLSGLVRDTGTDLAAAIRAKLAKNRIRDWSAPPNEQGYVKARAALVEHDAAVKPPR